MSDKAPTVSIIIVHYNTITHLTKLLATLSRDKNLQIIVVDNYFSDQVTDKVKTVAERHQQNHNILLITNQDNRGFAAACNQGASWAKGEWILFLNPDIEVEPAQLHAMVDQAAGRRLAACSPTPKSTDYLKPVPTGLSLLTEFTPLKYLLPLSFFKQRTLTGGFLLIQKKVLKKIGGWDERFFLWFEDSDLTQRLYNGHYLIGWVEIPHVHVGGVSLKQLDSDNQRYLFFTSMMQYARKHFGPVGQLIVRLLQYRYIPPKQEAT